MKFYTAKLYPVPQENLLIENIRDFETELYILKKSNHLFVVKYIDDFLIENK